MTTHTKHERTVVDVSMPEPLYDRILHIATSERGFNGWAAAVITSHLAEPAIAELPVLGGELRRTRIRIPWRDYAKLMRRVNAIQERNKVRAKSDRSAYIVAVFAAELERVKEDRRRHPQAARHR